ncbi:MAG: type II 3-dehydroquinate dehydratase [Proteobacteria bacterium]|nr:type II 3-dehydroquinate dehydratase [Pseudomonadota bacterium]MBU4276900.1 type II 3-dehydroquinate dehydratase [Pseudomonadota bacterium]MBU4383219.1 type II 3-dehydroquinate dehydratase [Pseudomonadota bacterium]MBU4603416.1 type II 3-dehydroquinate dehydratase [Pseudomonadota bacterium]MCG2764259.1 type II 3-dehydroquinate dehydratase [Desulfarculaceae bacterium]
MKILLLNGPNLNMLGRRESEHYGSLTLDEINRRMGELAQVLGLELGFAQSNHEGELVDILQQAAPEYAGVALNAGGYTHTSVALRDAVLCCGVPVVEVHLSQPAAREEFRRHSYLAGACAGSVAGFGWRSYALALHWFAMLRGDEQ